MPTARHLLGTLQKQIKNKEATSYKGILEEIRVMREWAIDHRKCKQLKQRAGPTAACAIALLLSYYSYYTHEARAEKRGRKNRFKT